MNPLANATLREIAQPGPADRAGKAGGPVAVWEGPARGRARGYLRRGWHTMTAKSVQAQNRVEVFTIPLSAWPAGAPEPEAGAEWTAATVVIDDERRRPTIQRRFTVVGIRTAAAGTPVDSVRLELRLAR